MERYDLLKQVESNARTYAATFERVFERGRGVLIWDSQGREFIDCLTCAGALPLGHNHPEITEEVLRFLSSGQLQQALDLTTPAKFEFVREILASLPSDMASSARIQFCSPSGSDAVEAALKLVRFATKRKPIIAFHGAYHGMTRGSLGAMGNLALKSALGDGTEGIHFAPYPDTFHCPFGSDGSKTDELAINYLRTLLTDPGSGVSKPAGLLVEVVQGEGGCIPVSPTWLRAVRQLTAEQDVPLMIDEVQTGLGRTGRMFAFQHAGIVPDVLILSKAIGGGYPMAVVVYDQRLDVWPRGMHAGTFRGNQIAMVAGRRTLDIIRRDGLDHRAAHLGGLLRSGLHRIAERFPVLADVRGLGLMVGVEVLRAGQGNKPDVDDGNLARRIKLAAFANGLLLETGGRHGSVLRFLPPLILEESDVGAILDRFEKALESALKPVRSQERMAVGGLWPTT
jgi:diaminobutyrate-2-oxoglutarate transaminase